jgi:hypothetical protein
VTANNSAKAASLLADWKETWPRALATWSAYTLLRDPRFFDSNQSAKGDGMAGEIAAIRLRDQTVMVNVAQVVAMGLEGHALAILAHEVGHHVYVPGNLTDHGRMIAAMTRMMTGLPRAQIAMAANLYADLLINDRLQRRAGVDMAAVYKELKKLTKLDQASETWKLYTRTYEHLWRLPPETLSPPGVGSEMDGDAMLLARIVRSFAGEWLRGARRFAAVLYRYLAEDELERRGQNFVELGLGDTGRAAGAIPGEADAGGIPDGLAEIDASESGEGEELDGDFAENQHGSRRRPPAPPNTAPNKEGRGRPGAQYRQPFEYGALLEALGLKLSEHEVTTRYYRERALPHLIPFPTRRAPNVLEPLAEGLTSWEAGEPLETLDYFGSILQSPRIIPGVTTVQRVYGESPGHDPARVPMDLDIYIDCSGSMPNPAVQVSYLALAGTIVAMSALRAGARVQATLWSDFSSFETTRGFIRDEKHVLGVITGYISGGTAFPLHILRDTYQDRKASDPPVHILVVSDDGADTMLWQDGYGGSGEAICANAIARARGGGTLVLNLQPREQWKAREPLEQLGYRIHAVTEWDELVAFARAFVRENYGEAA